MKIWQLIRAFFGRLFATGSGGFLCDSCRYNYGHICTRPERPNAKTCPDYKRK